MVIYVALMADAFFGYLLPWGNMSYWGAQVIISLFGAIPLIGEPLAEWIRGDFVVSDATLNRFFAFHVILLPLLLALLVSAGVGFPTVHSPICHGGLDLNLKEHAQQSGTSVTLTAKLL